jgi:hypothetical protein
MRAKKRAPLAH